MKPHRDTDTPGQKSNEAMEHSTYSAPELDSVSRTVRTGKIEVSGVNVANLLTTLGMAAALVWHASIVTWRASELSTGVRELQATVQVLRVELQKFQDESRAARLDFERRLARVEARVDAHVGAR